MTRALLTSITLDQSPSRIAWRCTDDACQVRRTSFGHQETGQTNKAEHPETPESDEGLAIDELRDALSAIAVAVADAEQARRHSLDELQQLAIELSTAIASELVFRSIDANEHSVGEMVSMAVTRLGLDSPLSIALHPADLELVESLANDADGQQEWETADITLRPDGTLPRGNCRATNGTTTLLSEITPRMEEIRRLLWEGLDDAQIERRQAAQLNSPLKRFPDRRETA